MAGQIARRPPRARAGPDSASRRSPSPPTAAATFASAGAALAAAALPMLLMLMLTHPAGGVGECVFGSHETGMGGCVGMGVGVRHIIVRRRWKGFEADAEAVGRRD